MSTPESETDEALTPPETWRDLGFESEEAWRNSFFYGLRLPEDPYEPDDMLVAPPPRDWTARKPGPGAAEVLLVAIAIVAFCALAWLVLQVFT